MPFVPALYGIEADIRRGVIGLWKREKQANFTAQLN